MHQQQALADPMAPAGDNKTGTQRHVGHTHKASCPCGDEWPSPRARAAPAGGTLPAPVSPLRRFWGVVVGQESKAGGSVAKQGAQCRASGAQRYTHMRLRGLYTPPTGRCVRRCCHRATGPTVLGRVGVQPLSGSPRAPRLAFPLLSVSLAGPSTDVSIALASPLPRGRCVRLGRHFGKSG